MKDYLIIISKTMVVSAVSKEQAVEKAYHLLPKYAKVGVDILSREVDVVDMKEKKNKNRT